MAALSLIKLVEFSGCCDPSRCQSGRNVEDGHVHQDVEPAKQLTTLRLEKQLYNDLIRSAHSALAPAVLMTGAQRLISETVCLPRVSG